MRKCVINEKFCLFLDCHILYSSCYKLCAMFVMVFTVGSMICSFKSSPFGICIYIQLTAGPCPLVSEVPAAPHWNSSKQFCKSLVFFTLTIDRSIYVKKQTEHQTGATYRTMQQLVRKTATEMNECMSRVVAVVVLLLSTEGGNE